MPRDRGIESLARWHPTERALRGPAGLPRGTPREVSGPHPWDVLTRICTPPAPPNHPDGWFMGDFGGLEFRPIRGLPALRGELRRRAHGPGHDNARRLLG